MISIRVFLSTAILLHVAAVWGADTAPDPSAQQTYTLQQLLSMARAHSPVLASARADRDAANASLRSAQSAGRLKVSATTYGTTGNVSNIVSSSPGVQPSNSFIVPNKPFVDQNLMLMVPISTGRSFENGVLGAGRGVSASEASADAASRQLDSMIITDIAQVLGADLKLESETASLKTETEQLRDTEARLTDGRSSPLDLAKEQSAFGARQVSQRSAALDSRLARLALKRDIGVPSIPDFALDGTLDTLLAQSPPFASLDELHRQIDQNSSEIAAARFALRQMQAREKVASAAYSPQIYGVAMADGNTMGHPIVGVTLGFSASIPLVDGGQRSADVAAAKANTSRAQAALDLATVTAEQTVNANWERRQSALQQIPEAVAALDAASKASDLTNLRYTAGKALLSERLDAAASVSMAEASLAQIKVELISANAALAEAAAIDPVH